MNINPKVWKPVMTGDGWGEDYADMRTTGRLNTVKDHKWVVSERYVKAEEYLKLAAAYNKLQTKHARHQRYVTVVRKVLYAILSLDYSNLTRRHLIWDLLLKGEWKKHEETLDTYT